MDDLPTNRFYVWDQIRILFEKLGGVKKPDYITASQFEKLGRCSKLTNSNFGKADYAIVFKEFIRGSDSNYMAIEEFFKAIDVVISKLYPDEDRYESMKEFINGASLYIQT